MDPSYVYRALVPRVIDGDTFVALVDLGFYASILVHVRLHGVDAPELRSAAGPAAKAFLVDLIEGKQLVLASFHDDRSFERWVCDCWLDGGSVAQKIIDSGHGIARWV